MSVRPLPPFVRRLALLLFLALVPLLVSAGEEIPDNKPQAVLYVTRPLTRAEIAARNTHAKFEPPVGCYLGAFIDFDSSLTHPIRDQNRIAHQDPAGFEAIVGKSHAMYFFYLGYGHPLPLDWVRRLAAQNKFVHIALEPNDGLARVKDDAYLNKLAGQMALSGARIFLRFGSEMNGAWTTYHDPVEYRKKFRLVYSVMRRRAPNVALVWCPYTFPRINIKDYYPGDDATDWVGVNMYSVTYHNNDLREPCENEHTSDLLSYVYNRFAARKPFMICEFGATHYVDCEQRMRVEFAQRKILSLYTALARQFPRVKCINYFDSNNIQFTAHVNNDYSVTDEPTVIATYQAAIAAPYFLPAPLPLGPLWAPPPPAPMPLRRGELLRGPMTLSCWARTPSDRLSVRYKLDGAVIHTADRPDLWEFVWNAGSVRPGRHTLTLEVLRENGKIAATQSVAVTTSP